MLDEPRQSIRFDNVAEPPLLSINRGFSAPIIVEAERRPGELERLAQTDTEPFARYEAIQELMMRALVAGARGEPADPAPVIGAVAATLQSNSLDPAFKAEAILIPSDSPDRRADGRGRSRRDPRFARERCAKRSAPSSRTRFSARIAATAPTGTICRRAPRASAGCAPLPWACSRPATPRHGAALAKAQFDRADNMTDRQGALGILASLDVPERQAALDAFYARFHDDPLVLDKWFALQAAAQRPDTVDQVLRLAAPSPTSRSPTRIACARSPGRSAAITGRSIRPDGRGYAFLADMILAADKLNPQVAARMVPAFGRWRRFEPKRAELMRQTLERIVADSGIIEGRVRAGLEEPRLAARIADPAGDFGCDLDSRRC